MPHFTFAIEGWTHFNEAVKSKNATRGTELMLFVLFVFLFVSEPLGVVPQKARLLPHSNKGTSEPVHPMTSLRPTLIHIFIYLFIFPPIHSSAHLFNTDTSVHFHLPSWKHIHDILRSIPKLSLNHLFFLFLVFF